MPCCKPTNVQRRNHRNALQHNAFCRIAPNASPALHVQLSAAPLLTAASRWRLKRSVRGAERPLRASPSNTQHRPDEQPRRRQASARSKTRRQAHSGEAMARLVSVEGVASQSRPPTESSSLVRHVPPARRANPRHHRRPRRSPPRRLGEVLERRTAIALRSPPQRHQASARTRQPSRLRRLRLPDRPDPPLGGWVKSLQGLNLRTGAGTRRDNFAKFGVVGG